jgi:hypothetical protein
MRLMRSRAALALLTALAAVGCGRSSLDGNNPDCPPGAHCIPVEDMARNLDMRGVDMRHDMSDMHGDMRGGDMRDMGHGHEICNNGIDDNDNGLIDCADPECFNDPACLGLDMGSCMKPDGTVDCSRPPCNTLPQCLHQTCMPEIEYGTVTPHDYDQTKTFDTRNATDEYKTCAFPGGTARVGEFTLTTITDVRLDFTQPSGSAHVVTLNRAGFGQLCDDNQLFCLKAGQAPTTTHTFAALGPGTYYVIVQSYPGTQGATTVRISTGHGVEICDNGIDDDGNGLIDCADYACINAPNCVNQECKPDKNLGALVVGDPSKTADFDTHSSTNRYHPTCAGTSTGNDYVVRFTLHETAGVLVDWSQGSGGDHVISIFKTPPPGQACDTTQMSCYYPGGASSGTVAFSPRPPGDYIFIIKAIKSGVESPFHMSVRAYMNRQMEICNNGIDDDGNGLTDCEDPACFGVDGCKPPICTADVDLGNFAWGTRKSVMLDTRMAYDYYAARCAQGGGKERVVRLTLTQPMGLGYNCTETGSQVLQLTQQLQPLDYCDANPVNCADPSVLPFGCNFIMPNLQPGKYNLIVQAFSAGQEGTVNLTLTGEQERVLEICNNGIDDDMDGFTDCADKKCYTSPYCQKYRCISDKNMGLLPLDGSSTTATVQTSGNGDKYAAPCASASGGQDATVDFQVPGKANLTLQWAQTGNHVLALYTNDNDLAACNAGTLINCTASAGVQTGTINLPSLAAGKYHLIVDADHPGSEGGVIVTASGTPAP